MNRIKKFFSLRRTAAGRKHPEAVARAVVETAWMR